MNTKNILHENLKHYRTQKELSQTDVANHLSVSRQAISNWESGRSYPDLDNIILEILCLAVILVLASQFAVLGMLAPILVVIWLKKSKRNYKIVYILCLVIFLIGMRNAYVIVEHTLNLGKAHIESV